MIEKDILGQVNTNIISIDKSKSVADAIYQMVENEVGALIVVDGEKPVGMFTERDVLKSWTRKGNILFKDIKVSEVMTTNLLSVRRRTTSAMLQRL